MFQINAVLGSTQLSLLWICTIVAAMVFAAIMYSTATFRHSDVAHSKRIRKSAAELAWAVVPIFIVIAAAAPAIKGAVPANQNRGFVTESRVENRDAPCTALNEASVSRSVLLSTRGVCGKTR